MRRWHLRVAAFTVGCLLLAAVAVMAAQEMKTQQAVVTADVMKYNWKANTWYFNGNCRVDVAGPDKAMLTAPKMTGKVGKGGTQLNEIVASGPVSFDVTVRADESGVQRRIVASCKGQAVFTGVAKTITLTGGAQGQMTSIPAEPETGPAVFSGETVTINLADFTVEVSKGRIEAEFAAPQEGGQPKGQ